MKSRLLIYLFKPIRLAILRKIPCLLLLCFFIDVGLHAQTERDTLWAEWKNESLPDTSRAWGLTDYIYADYFHTQPDSAIILADTLLSFTKRINFEQGTVEAFYLIGYLYFRTGEYQKAADNYEEGLALAEEIGDKSGAARILLKTGYIHHDNGDLIRALKYYQRSLKLFEETQDLDGIGSVYNEYGSIYREKNQYEKSLDYYFRTIALNDSLDDEYGNAAIFQNIGSLYLVKGDYDEALSYMQRGLDIYQEQGDKLGIASGLAGIGSVLYQQDKTEEAMDFFQRSLAISEQIEDIQGAAATMVNIADIHVDRGQYRSAIVQCRRSLEWSQALGDVNGQWTAYDCLYYAYKQAGNMRKALEHHELMLVFRDSLKSEETAERIQQMEFTKIALADSLDQVEKDKQVEIAHMKEIQKKDKNRNMAIGAGVFFVLLSGGFFSRWRYVKKTNAIIEKEKDRSENLLLNILPAEIAEELKEKGEADARDFDMVSILFTDFKGFTEKSEKLTAKELIDEINVCFRAFDHICESYRIEKIKTIGDAYMAAGGLPEPSDDAVKNTVLAALAMKAFIDERIAIKRAKNEIPFEMRLGIHTGPVVAGIVGVKKFQYDIWGDTVNTASRMESGGETGRVNISQQTYELVKHDPQFTFEARGKIQVKGKKDIHMYFVDLN